MEPVETESHGVNQPKPHVLKVVLGTKEVELSYEKAFALACSSLEQEHPHLAVRLFRRLTEAEDRGSRAWIMRAFCEAAAKRWSECSEALTHISPEAPTSRQLHDIFVLYHAGFRDQAIKELLQFVKSHPEYPTLYLLLGDLFAKKRLWPAAKKCWAFAIKHDRPGGSVARVSRERLRTLSKKRDGSEGN